MIEYIHEGIDAQKIIAADVQRKRILDRQANPFVWFMGRVQNKLIGKNPIIEMRPFYLAEELGIVFQIDHQKRYKKIYSVRGWIFQKEEKSIVIRVSDSKKRSIPFYLKTEVRDDAERAFNRKEGTVLGFCIYVNCNGHKVDELNLEFEVEGIFTAYKPDFEEYQECDLIGPEYYVKALDLQLSIRELKMQKRVKFRYNPMISVIVPLYNTPLDYLQEMIDSVLNQSYSNIQLCLADGSSKEDVEIFVRQRYGKNRKVLYKRLKDNKGISENTNAAYQMATGDFIMLCDHDDIVMPNACYEMVKVINQEQDVDIVYTDEDKVAMDGIYYFGPHYKPDFNLAFLRDNNYICHVFLVRKSLADKLDGPELKEYDGAQDFDFILRCAEKAEKICHIPKVLYHWRCHPLSTAMNPQSKLYAYEAGKKAVIDSYRRNGIDADVEMTRYYGRYHSRFKVKDTPSVRIIIWGDDTERLHKNADILGEYTSYSNYDVVCVDGISCNKDSFFPDFKGLQKLNEEISGIKDGYCVLLYQDTMFMQDSWLEEMLGYCNLENYGICGAKIITDDRYIYSCGQYIDHEGNVCEEMHGLSMADTSAMGRAESSREVSSISIHGMMFRVSLWNKIGGFNPEFGSCAVADFCLRAGQSDIKTVENVYVELGIVSQNSAWDDVSKVSNTLFRKKWNDFIVKGDPMYNPQISYWE